MTIFQPDSTTGQAPAPGSIHPRESTVDAPTSVARLNDTIRGFIEKWGFVWVEGEITGWNLRSGNVFGRLKDLDSDATISFRLWSKTLQRTPGDLKVGDHVIACVKADYFVKTGDFTFTVSSVRHVGLGDQLERLERLQDLGKLEVRAFGGRRPLRHDRAVREVDRAKPRRPRRGLPEQPPGGEH